MEHNLYKWTENFLSNREFTVVCNNQKSKVTQIKAGVPQGSSLSPTLFAIFFSDIVNKISNNTKKALFADDLAIWFSDESLKNVE